MTVAHKPFNTLRQQLVDLKDKTPNKKKCGVVYQVDCSECNQQYIEETGRTLETRFKEHVSTSGNPSAIREHMNTTGHNITMDSVKILGREDHLHKRKIKEAVAIRRHQPTMNRDGGYELAAVYDRLLSHDHPGHVTPEGPSNHQLTKTP